MRVTIERLRVWLLVGAGLLVVVIAGFLFYAHFRAHRFLKDLPGRLGANITRESNGFTYSQSGKGGKTIYTIHAAKLVQYKDGKTTLRDVGIVLYGQRQDRADRIYGSEFEYDQRTGVVRAMGEVHLDLQAPAPADSHGRETVVGVQHPADDDRMVHVKTSGLVFVQSLGAASTDQEIEFQYHGLSGRAKGADYNSDTGVTVLQSEVRVSGLRDGQPVLLTAVHAEMDRGTGQVTLSRARYVSVGGSGAGKGGERTVSAEEAVVRLRGDGSVERVLGGGGVSLADGDGLLKGQSAEVTVSAESRPETAHVFGGMSYMDEGQLRQVEGRAGQGTARFDAAGRIGSAAMSESAELHVRERASEALPWSERTISGGTIDMRFATAEGNRQWLRDGTATRSARMLLVDRKAGKSKTEETVSELRGDSLAAALVWDGYAAKLNHVSGAGHAALRRRDANGGEDTSEGETLEVSFGRPAASRGKGVPAKGAAGLSAGSQVSSAVQAGGVRVTRVPAIKPGSTEKSVPLHATAALAEFDGGAQTLTLRGQAQVAEGDSLLRADAVTVRRDTGDATAVGSVQASYQQAGSSQPVHVLASRAEFTRASGQARFYGGDGGRGAAARLWQGASQVEAPVIEFSQREKTLLASAKGDGDAMVHTVLVGGAERDRPQVMRVTSRRLRYSDADRRAIFDGGVVLQNADGTVRGGEVTALLKPATASADRPVGQAAGRQTGFMGGSVDRVIADGRVEVSEGGRRATGERLVYTASDGMFVMTGTPASPPKVVDEVQGTITGAALQFHTGDNSVMVLGDSKGEDGRRVRTETQVRKR